MNENYNYEHEFLPIIDHDEQIVWTGKPKAIPFVFQGVSLLIVGIFWFILVGVMMPTVSDGFFAESGSFEVNAFIIIPNLIRFFPLVIGIGRMTYLIFALKKTKYAITSKRLLFRSGIIGIDYKIVDYDQIKNMEVNVNPLEKMMQVGSIRVFSGEMITTNQTTRSVPTTMVAIPNPYEVFKLLKKTTVDIKTDWNYPNQYRPAENEGYKTKYKK